MVLNFNLFVFQNEDEPLSGFFDLLPSFPMRVSLKIFFVRSVFLYWYFLVKRFKVTRSLNVSG